MNVLFVPSIGLPESIELLDRLAASVDYPVKYKVVLNNGLPDALEAWQEAHSDWIVAEPATGNLGCAGGWNWIAKRFPDEPTILIMNEDTWFLPGYLQKICETAGAYTDAPIIYLNDSHAFYCFVHTKAGRERIGTFDENFFVSYYEDCDYRVRLKLAGVTDHVFALQGLEPLPHGKPRTGGVNYNALLQGCGLLNRAYWKRKWGSYDYENALYQTPYKDHRLTYKDWIWYPEERAIRYPLWNSFMQQKPSLYD